MVHSTNKFRHTIYILTLPPSVGLIEKDGGATVGAKKGLFPALSSSS